MTRIIYRHDPPGLVARGHTDYAERGRDIVCAAVSVLCMTLQEALKECGISSKVRTGDGYFRVEAETDSENRDRAETVFTTVLSGMKLLALNYPGCLELSSAADPTPTDTGEIMRLMLSRS